MEDKLFVEKETNTVKRSRIVVGLDIGTTKIACFVGRKNEHNKIEIISMGKSESLGVMRGVVSNIEKTIQSFIDANLWDEARVFIGEIKLHEGTKAPELNKAIYSKMYLKKDTLLTYRNDD